MWDRTRRPRSGSSWSGSTRTGAILILLHWPRGTTFWGHFRVENDVREHGLEEVALTQLLPAGWEIENTRLVSEAQPDWMKKWRLNAEEYLDIRDDRIDWFFDLPRRGQPLRFRRQAQRGDPKGHSPCRRRKSKPCTTATSAPAKPVARLSSGRNRRDVMRITALYLLAVSTLGAILYFLIPLPRPLFAPDYSTLIVDRDGQLLRAFLNDGQQWCFPPDTSLAVPAKLRTAVLHFEDRRFLPPLGR